MGISITKEATSSTPRKQRKTTQSKLPLILNKHPLEASNTNDLDDDFFYLPPEDADEIVKGTKFYLGCPGEENKLTEISYIGDYLTRDFTISPCDVSPQSTVQVSEEHPDGIQILHVGFQFGSSFIKLIEIRYDTNNGKPIYSKYAIDKDIRNLEKDSKHGSNFSAFPYYYELSSDLYANQVHILGDQDISDPKGTLGTLQKGHLAAAADFPYFSQQNATMYLINTVPMWRKVNQGIWKSLENHVRNLAKNTEDGLIVFAGGIYVLRCKNTEGKEVPLYMRKQGGEHCKIPIPELMFKIIYDKKNKMATAFTVRNTPDEEYDNQNKQEENAKYYTIPGCKKNYKVRIYNMEEFLNEFEEELKHHLPDYLQNETTPFIY